MMKRSRYHLCQVRLWVSALAVAISSNSASGATLTFDAQVPVSGTLTTFTQELTLADTPIVFDVVGGTRWEFPITGSETTTASGTEMVPDGNFIGARFEAQYLGGHLEYFIRYPVAANLAGELLDAYHLVNYPAFTPPAVAFTSAVAGDSVFAIQPNLPFTDILTVATYENATSTFFEQASVDPSSIVFVPEPASLLLMLSAGLFAVRRQRHLR